MHGIVVLGCGKIGRMIARFLSTSGDYDVTMADRDEMAVARVARQSAVKTQIVDATDPSALAAVLEGKQAVISALSYRFNPLVARAALARGTHYFDLTEDVGTTHEVRGIAAQAKPGQVFMPQCGLAPGFVSIAAYQLTKSFDRLDTVHMRVGALPQFPSNALKYNLTWSTDGLINEYCNPCEAIHEHEKQIVLPLEGLEHFSLDGVRYEAFNTSGGLGSLCDTLGGTVRELNYKTIRYLGHRELVVFLLNELRMSEHRAELKQILERAIPVTFQDVVVVFCTVSGWRRGQHVQITDARKIYHQRIDGENWSAIQITTGAGVSGVVDLVFDGTLSGTGFLPQEAVALPVFLNNRFGRYYETTAATRFSLPGSTSMEGIDGDS